MSKFKQNFVVRFNKARNFNCKSYICHFQIKSNDFAQKIFAIQLVPFISFKRIQI